jgi:hypothetical protein
MLGWSMQQGKYVLGDEYDRWWDPPESRHDALWPEARQWAENPPASSQRPVSTAAAAAQPQVVPPTLAAPVHTRAIDTAAVCTHVQSISAASECASAARTGLQSIETQLAQLVGSAPTRGVVAKRKHDALSQQVAQLSSTVRQTMDVCTHAIDKMVHSGVCLLPVKTHDDGCVSDTSTSSAPPLPPQQVRWYWKDDAGHWIVYSEWAQIELKYQVSPAGSCRVTINGIGYTLDFSTWKQARDPAVAGAAAPGAFLGTGVRAQPPPFKVRDIKRVQAPVVAVVEPWPAHWIYAPEDLLTNIPVHARNLPEWVQESLHRASGKRQKNGNGDPITPAPTTPTYIPFAWFNDAIGCKLLRLSELSATYKTVVNQFQSKMGHQLEFHGTNTQMRFSAQVKDVYQVQHARLWHQYAARRAAVQNEVDPLAQQTVETTLLYHGTSWKALPQILEQGFNPNLNPSHEIGKMFGVGTYASPLSSLATHYASIRGCNEDNEVVMLVCRAVTGWTEVGKRGQRANTPRADGSFHHSTVDRLVEPMQYCLPHTNQIHVDHVVRFSFVKTERIKVVAAAAAAAP